MRIRRSLPYPQKKEDILFKIFKDIWLEPYKRGNTTTIKYLQRNHFQAENLSLQILSIVIILWSSQWK